MYYLKEFCNGDLMESIIFYDYDCMIDCLSYNLHDLDEIEVIAGRDITDLVISDAQEKKKCLKKS